MPDKRGAVKALEEQPAAAAAGAMKALTAASKPVLKMSMLRARDPASRHIRNEPDMHQGEEFPPLMKPKAARGSLPTRRVRSDQVPSQVTDEAGPPKPTASADHDVSDGWTTVKTRIRTIETSVIHNCTANLSKINPSKAVSLFLQVAEEQNVESEDAPMLIHVESEDASMLIHTQDVESDNGIQLSCVEGELPRASLTKVVMTRRQRCRRRAALAKLAKKHPPLRNWKDGFDCVLVELIHSRLTLTHTDIHSRRGTDPNTGRSSVQPAGSPRRGLRGIATTDEEESDTSGYNSNGLVNSSSDDEPTVAVDNTHTDYDDSDDDISMHDLAYIFNLVYLISSNFELSFNSNLLANILIV